MRRSTKLLLALAVTGSLVATACSDSSDPGGAADPTTTAAGGDATATTGDGGGSTTTIAPVEWDFAAVTPIVEDFIAEHELNGAGLVIVHRDHGIIDEQYFGEFDADRISLVASSSKMITAGVLAHLQDEGLLDMDAPVADVAEWGAGNPDITPAQLVSNSSGLIGLGPEAGMYVCQYSPNGTMQECAETIFTTTADDANVIPPDTEFRYGGGQWQVAGAVAEVASGKTWAELIDEIYVQPCGLDVMAYNNHFLQGLAGGAGAFEYPLGFEGDPTKLKATDNPNMEGGVYITTGDYAQLLLMHLRGGRCGDTQVLSTEALDMLHGDRIGEAYGGGASIGESEAPDVGYGMGWWVDRETGRITDPGAYGSVPWLDLEDGYGAYLVVESTSETGMALAAQLFDVVDEAIAEGVAAG